MKTPIYIQLLHGRTDPNQDMEETGFAGPTFGPYQDIHQVYNTEIQLINESDVPDILHFDDDMLYYNDSWYGDHHIFTLDEEYAAFTGLVKKHIVHIFEQTWANLPYHREGLRVKPINIRGLVNIHGFNIASFRSETTFTAMEVKAQSQNFTVFSHKHPESGNKAIGWFFSAFHANLFAAAPVLVYLLNMGLNAKGNDEIAEFKEKVRAFFSLAGRL